METGDNFRTDLASEAHRLRRGGGRELEELPGVEAEEKEENGFPVFRVRICGGEGARLLGKPPGRYCTLEAEKLFSRGDGRFPSLVRTLAGLIREQLGPTEGPYLVAGLGNEEITPDALGPFAAREVLATRHLRRTGDPLFRDLAEVSVCTPGVLGSSGLEAARQIAALCRELRPACVIAIDALAGAEPERLCRTLQITDSGIAPGSGVGNDREPLCVGTLGLPVLALGVPTVIDAACLGNGALRGMFVTPRDIAQTVRCAARVIAWALDLALHPGLTTEELSALLE